MTGLLFWRTSSSQLSSVTALVAPIVITPSVLNSALLSSSGRVLSEPALGVDRRGASAARRGDVLAGRVVHHVAAGEDALNGGPGGPVSYTHLTLTTTYPV